jgi:hypothetical protein
MDSPQATACAVGCPIRRSEDQRALAPPLGFSQRATSFIASRCQGIHQMPFMCRARAQPQARALRVLGRDQWSAIRDQTSQAPATWPDATPSDLCHLISDLWSANTAPADARASAYAYPCPGPISPGGDDRTCFTVTTRFTMSKGQRSEVGDQRSDRERARTGRARFRHRLRHPIFANAIPMTRMPEHKRRPS